MIRSMPVLCLLIGGCSVVEAKETQRSRKAKVHVTEVVAECGGHDTTDPAPLAAIEVPTEHNPIDVEGVDIYGLVTVDVRGTDSVVRELHAKLMHMSPEDRAKASESTRALAVNCA